MLKPNRYCTMLGVLLVFSLVGCATPTEIKQLSTAQISYFNSAIEAVKTQSETLLLAARKISNAAKARIDQLEKTQMDRFKKLAVNTIPGQELNERGTTADKMLKQVVVLRSTSIERKAKLDADLDAIKAKSEELQRYLTEMKNVQVALDAYLQSKKAGESFLQDILKLPGVQNLIGTVKSLIPKVENGVKEIQAIINGLEVNQQ